MDQIALPPGDWLSALESDVLSQNKIVGVANPLYSSPKVAPMVLG